MEEVKTLSNEVDIRRKKIEDLKAMGEIPFKSKFDCTCTIAQAREKVGEKVRVAGRMVFRRIMGKFGFMQIDPIVQRKALEDQQLEKAQGDEETMDVDEDFLLAMEHGMPPMSGLGFGIDRFLMFLYDLPNIRDTVLFPIMK